MKLVDIVKVYQTTAYEVNWQALSDAVEKLAMAKLAEDLEHWKSDRGMRAMFLADAASALEVCEVMVKGQWHEVDKKLWEMDTAARDYVYDWIAEVAGEDFFKIVRG
jgi:hypothetical protein